MKKDKRPSIRWSEHEIGIVDAKRGDIPFSKYVRLAALREGEERGIAGEDLKKGDPIYLGQDGKFYKVRNDNGTGETGAAKKAEVPQEGG